MSPQPSKSLIINTPYEPPTRYWAEPRGEGRLEIIEGRRPAGYEIFDIRNNTRRTERLELVNRIRERVDAWRDAAYPGITSVTRRLLEHWHDGSVRDYPFFFCQLEAVETLIWHVEAAAEFKQGIAIPGDGGAWERLCSKMATGSGKTNVMGLIVCWQVLNSLTYPKRKDFSRAIFVVAPGITVKERLQVLYPGNPHNVYDQFNLCPSDALRQRLNQAEVLVENWHTLMPLKQPERSVVKKGAESDEAFSRRVLGKLAAYRDLVVINDEAHHAYRIPAEFKGKRLAGASKEELEEATRWIEGLDRLHKTRRLLRAFDLTATPFAPTGRQATERGLFGWIVSDFGLNDAIEAGLVKTPRIVVRDNALPDASSYKSRLYHLYNDHTVKDDLNRKADPSEPPPDLVQKAYALLGADWREAWRQWRAEGHDMPPVMLTVCNRTETAARVEQFFTRGDCLVEELGESGKTLRVDSRVLEKAEAGASISKDKAYANRLAEIITAADLPADREAALLAEKQEVQLRAIVDNVGKRGTAGQRLRNIISVAMLSEGWDAPNVTHILGLRAFTSQLLCEQVIGRGLRRVSYEFDEDGRLTPEYVNVFGVPLSIFQDVGDEGVAPKPPKYSTQIEVLPERHSYEIRWPNVLRVETVLKPALTVDWDQVEPLKLQPEMTPSAAELAPALAGHTDLSKVATIDLTRAAEQFRLQRLVFQAARKVLEQTDAKVFKGSRELLAIQLIRLVEEFLRSDKLVLSLYLKQDDLRRRILIGLNVDLVVSHVRRFVTQQNQERLEPVFDADHPIGSTGFMRSWFTTKPNHPTRKSHISHVVYDSTWESMEAYALENSDRVHAYAKNDHLNFDVLYNYNGVVRKFRPDYLIRLASGKTLVLEVKGQDSDQNRVKREYLDLWVRAINANGGFGQWEWDVSREPGDIQDILLRHS